jgi:hypothetical protein
VEWAAFSGDRLRPGMTVNWAAPGQMFTFAQWNRVSLIEVFYTRLPRHC